MGVYQNIRSNTYKKPQGVYARIHANDDKIDTQNSVSNSTEAAPISMFLDPNYAEKTLAERTTQSVLNSLLNYDANPNNPIGRMQAQTKEKLKNANVRKMTDEEKKAFEEKYKPNKEVDAAYYGKRAYEGLLGASEGVMDGATILGSKFVATPILKGAEAVTSLGGKAPNPVSEKMKELANETWQEIPKKMVDTKIADFYSQNELSQYAPNSAQQLAGDVLSGASGMLPTIGSNLLLPGAGYATLGTQGFGSGVEDAATETGELGNKEMIYGGLSGLSEAAIEKLSGGIAGLGKGGLKELGEKVIKNRFVRGALGEGAEEMIQTAIDPLLKRATYDPDAELASAKDIAYAGAVGALTNLALGAPGEVSQTLRNNRENKKVQAQINQDIKNYKNIFNDSKPNLQNVNNVKNVLRNLPQMAEVQQPNITSLKQAEMAQKANMNQIRGNTKLITQRAETTLQSAKIAGANDINMNKAIELNDLLRSGAEVKFYNPQNIPQGVDANKAKVANGFYSNGTVWINKNTKNAVEVVLGHELTHHLETTDSYTDLANTILDSDVFYDYIAEKGYSNVAEYKQSLGQNYTAEQFDSEMVANFVQDKLFSDQNSIDRLARQNTTLVEKIKNWISDLVVSFKGTAQEKELRRIEGMYRKALEQARNTTTRTTETQYSYSGTVGLDNLKSRYSQMNAMQREFVDELENNYQKALYLSSRGYKNDQILKETGWFESDGKWKWEIPDEYFKLKDSANLSNGEHNLSEIIEHDLVFMVYPDLAKQKVVVSDKVGKSFYNTLDDKIYLKIGDKTKSAIELNLLHELQHSIQNIEGFDGGTSTLGGMLRYYEKHGEIEASDTVRRFKQGKKDSNFDRENVTPELSKENPKHPMLDKYLAGETKKQTPIRDYLYQKSKEKGNGIYEKVDRKAFGMEVDEADNAKDMRVDNGGRNGRYVNDTAGKEPAFSMPETDNQGRKLSAEQQEFFKDSKVRDEQGKLLEVYHGTKTKGINIFNYDPNRQTGTDYGKAYYFTTDYSKAQGYQYDIEKDPLYMEYNKEDEKWREKVFNADNETDKTRLIKEWSNWHKENNVMKILNNEEFTPERLPDGETKKLYLNIKNPHIVDAEGQYYFKVYDDYFKQARENGNDGIIVKNVVDNPRGEPRPIDVYIVFEPNQIKNVDNTNPTSNPDIRYSMNPVELAKNPPNPQTGLDSLNKSKRVKEGDRQSSFAENLLNQSIFDEKFTDLALDDKNISSYESISNKETLQKANDAINEQGQKWVDRFKDKSAGDMKAEDIAGGFILMSRYQQVGDYESMLRIAEKLREAGTKQGQTIQLFSIMGRMTPEGMTYYAQKELSKAYDEILKNKTQAWADEHADEFKLNERDIDFIQRRVNQASKLPEGRDKYILLAEISERIQNKIPPQAGQSLKALARNSMLLNPRTMVRNILGNVVIVPNHIISDFVGTGIDKAISKKTGVRTTGLINSGAIQGMKKGAYESFDDFRRKITTRDMSGDRFELGKGGKSFYEKHTGRFANTRNAINKALNGLDRVTGFLLETGDRPFYEAWFINSLNNQMKLNNATEPTAEMIEIATDEALQRTWQDNNTYTNAVRNVRDGLNKFNIKGYGLGDILMPFVKTPANLTKAVVDFSPLGAINAAIKTSHFRKDIGKGVATSKQQREVVKAWSQVITGSLGMAIMAALANAGVLGGGSDEDKDVRNFEQNILGVKPYSIKIGDNSYTYDWAQPLGTSAAMVADTVKSLKNTNDTEGKVAAILEGVQSGASVLLEQSFVSGIRNLFEEDNLINALIESGFNEFSKFTPQFLSQIAQLQDDTARTSYVYNDIPRTALNKVKAKIPGLRQTLEPSVDVLGREVKTDNSVGNVMFNPANTAFARTTEGAEEMYRVYQATGDKAAIAQVAPYYFNVGSDKVVLTPAQRTQYQKTIGKIASDGVENLLQIKSYKDLPDTEKAEVLKELYSYGNAIAKVEASTRYLLPKDMAKIKDSRMKPEEYILLKRISNLGGDKKDEKLEALITSGYSAKESKNFLSDYKGYKFN